MSWLRRIRDHHRRAAPLRIGLVALAAATLLSPTIAARAQIFSAPTTYFVTCHGVNDTSSIQGAVTAAGQSPGNTVWIQAGRCELYGHIAVKGANGVTITGAGQTTTVLVQHSRYNIFQITTPGNTVENMLLDTGTYNYTYPPVPKNPDPATLFSNSSNTSVLYVTSASGTGFGFRLTGPSPCSNHQVSGDRVVGVRVSNFGTGGFSAIDIDCNRSATLSNAVVHGGSITAFEDGQTTITNVFYSKGRYAMTCQPAWEVTGGHASIANLTTYNGYGRALNGAGVSVTNELMLRSSVCPPR